MSYSKNAITIYEGVDRPVSLSIDANKETIWANLNDIAMLFGTDKSGISRHIKKIYSEGELNMDSTDARNATVQTEGQRRIKRLLSFTMLIAESKMEDKDRMISIILQILKI
ncbi:MAG: death-on-curing protein [bacterium]